MSTYAVTDKAAAERAAKIFREVDWPIPVYLSSAFVHMLAEAIELAPQNIKLEVLRQTFAKVYSRERLAAALLERYSKIVHVRDFKRQIDESIKAYFSGYTHVAVTAMIPVFEGIIRRIAKNQGRDIGQGTKKLNHELDALVESERNSPRCYGERLVVLQAFRDFVQARLLQSTTTYTGPNELNRHGILHGIFDNYGEDINFFRLITLLDLLCVSVALIEGGVPSFAPEATSESRKLAEHYLQLNTLGLVNQP